MTPHEIAVRICEATISLAWQEEHAAIEAEIAKAIAAARTAALEEAAKVAEDVGCYNISEDFDGWTPEYAARMMRFAIVERVRALARKDGGT